MKPMLSGKAPDDLSQVEYPIYISPKLDGIRALVIGGVVVSRNLKPIPNRYVQELFGKPEYEGYDGELIVGEPTDADCFRNTTSGVMTHDGIPNVKYYVFDRWDITDSWINRFSSINSTERVIRLGHTEVHTYIQLIDLEQTYLLNGFEGVMLRSKYGPYKFGRSTTREGYLMKLKRFEDSEALVIGMEEKMHNANEAKVDALGHTERSSHIENLKPLDTMGALIVRDLKTNVEFNIGTGFDDSVRQWWWDQLINIGHVLKYGTDGGAIITITNPEIIVKYKYFPMGSKDKPRFPTYLGIRQD